MISKIRLQLSILIAAGGVVPAFAEAPPGYYQAAEGLSGTSLRGALNGIIDDHVVIRYSSSAFDTADAMEVLDDDPANSANVVLFYSERSEPKANFPGWNREHLWPNSYGIDDEAPAFSDLHNLRPVDANVNSSRGNKLFDDSSAADGNLTIPAHPEAPGNSRDTDSWEPPDSKKGDVARAAFYMAIRYEGVDGEPDLELTDAIEGVTTSGTLMGKLTTLILWHFLDPPDAIEEARNDGIFNLYQGNRNPFIDRPEWVTAIFGNPLQLEMVFASGNPTILWPSDLHRVELESSSDLDSWLSVLIIPRQQGYMMIVTDLPDGRKFYRLGVK